MAVPVIIAKIGDKLRTFWERIKQLIAKTPFSVWAILSGIIVTEGIVFLYELELRCILEYRISESGAVLISILIAGIGAVIGLLISDKISDKLKNIFFGFGGGVLFVFLLFFIRNIYLPPIPQDKCPIHSCVNANDIQVEFQILSNNDEVIDILDPFESVSLEPDVAVDFKVVITPIGGETLPTFEYTWTDTGSVTDGRLLQSVGPIVGYRSGRDFTDDAISLQLSQSTCPALALYPFFISLNEE